MTLLRELNRTGKRTLPDIVPMPFPSQHWRAVILHNATPQRRIYETAVVATLRDRLRAGDVWVAGSQDYRRFDAYLVPLDDAQRVLGDSALDTDGPAWMSTVRWWHATRAVGSHSAPDPWAGPRVPLGRGARPGFEVGSDNGDVALTSRGP